jgi:GTP-binding protein
MVPMPTGKFGDYLRAVFPNLDFVPIAFITAKSGKNVQTVLNLAQNLHKQASRRVSTSDLNRVLREALAQQQPPMRHNRRPKVIYGTQVSTNPPTLVLFTNGPELFDHTYQRYLIKAFRDRLGFADVPIKLYLRHKHRDDEMPGETPEGETPKPEPRRPERKKEKVDLSRLKFRSSVSDEELRRDRGQYESELWKDL